MIQAKSTMYGMFYVSPRGQTARGSRLRLLLPHPPEDAILPGKKHVRRVILDHDAGVKYEDTIVVYHSSTEPQKGVSEGMGVSDAKREHTVDERWSERPTA